MDSLGSMLTWLGTNPWEASGTSGKPIKSVVQAVLLAIGMAWRDLTAVAFMEDDPEVQARFPDYIRTCMWDVTQREKLDESLASLFTWLQNKM
jgi:hypothetical protein